MTEEETLYNILTQYFEQDHNGAVEWIKSHNEMGYNASDLLEEFKAQYGDFCTCEDCATKH